MINAIDYQVDMKGDNHPRFYFQAESFDLALDHLDQCMNDPEFVSVHGIPMKTTCRVKKVERTINITPTWVGTMGMLITLIESGDFEGKKYARDELMKLARQVDAINAQAKEVQS